ncbi:MAG TPA: Rieske 2Fe-2S domain-containing protein [Allosphingosinicella sp.]|nr:Rieske 2Fe-2S domain-containing protein [Allosphingosinicella sp.]
MLSAKDNEMMCRVGPETPMGKALRRYWTPALQSSDLPEPGGDPRRVELLGQTFVAFRGEDGVIGFLDEACPHRGVSLALGRVEECSLRCIFHGWRFDANGVLLETPNVAEPGFRTRVKAPAYPVREAGGLVWVYLGPKELEPPFPHYPWFDFHPDHRLNGYLVENSNFVQVIEALVDSSHLNILHADGLAATLQSDLQYAKANRPMLADMAPRMEAEATDFGFHYAALRKVEDGYEARITAFVAPYATVNPNANLWMAVVPINDDQSIYFHVFFESDRKIGIEPLRSEQLRFIGLDDEALRDSGLHWDTLNSPDKPSPLNGFKQNRDAMRRGETFSGFHSFSQEDAAVIQSAGALRDRRGENLAPSDAAIVRLYRTLLSIAKSAETGEDPVGLAADTMQIFGLQGKVPEGGWQAMVPTHRRVSQSQPRAGTSASL